MATVDTTVMAEKSEELKNEMDTLENKLNVLEEFRANARDAKEEALACNGEEIKDLTSSRVEPTTGGTNSIVTRYYAVIESTNDSSASISRMHESITAANRQAAQIKSLNAEMPAVIESIENNKEEVETALAKHRSSDESSLYQDDKKQEDSEEKPNTPAEGTSGAGGSSGSGGSGGGAGSSSPNYKKPTSTSAGNNTTTPNTSTLSNKSTGTSVSTTPSNQNSSVTTTPTSTNTTNATPTIPTTTNTPTGTNPDNPTPGVTVPVGETTHTGGGYSTDGSYNVGQDTTTIESGTEEITTGAIKDATNSIKTIIGKDKSSSIIPSEDEAVSSSSGKAVIPVAAGLSTAAAAAIGAKAIMDRKNDDEEIKAKQWTGDITNDVDYNDGIEKQETLDEDNENPFDIIKEVPTQ